MSDVERPLGPVIESLGITVCLDPDDQVTDVLAIIKTVNMRTGEVALSLQRNETADWITQRGMMAAALDLISQPAERATEE